MHMADSQRENSMSTEKGNQVIRQILDVKTAAKMLGRSASHVSNSLNGRLEGVPPIPHVRAGRLRLIRRAGVTGSIPPGSYTLRRCVMAGVIDRHRRQGHQPAGLYCSVAYLGAAMPRLSELDSTLTNGVSGTGAVNTRARYHACRPPATKRRIAMNDDLKQKLESTVVEPPLWGLGHD